MNHALVLDTVSQILDVFRPEEIVATVAYKVGDIDAYRTQRVQAIAATGLQITVDTGQRIHQLQDSLVAAHILHVAYCVWRVDIHIIGNFRFLGVGGRMQLVGRRGGEIAVVAQNRVDHIDTGLRIHTFDEHRLGCKMPVNPTLEAGGILIDIVIDHQADREWCPIVRRIERIVGTHIDSGENVGFHTFVHLYAVLMILEVLHAVVQDVILTQFSGR